MRYPTSSSNQSLCDPVTRGTPSSRRSSLSRSNIRSNASSVAQSAYWGTAVRICSLVSHERVDSRQMTRFSRRSVRCAGAAIAQHATRAPRRRAGRPWEVEAMIQWREGRVTRVRERRRGAMELDVDVVAAAGSSRESCPALAYPPLVGEPRVGDLVLLNTTALEADLGTGGYAFVIAVPERIPLDPSLGEGHLVKARYTPQQVTVRGADEQGSPHHALLRDADDLLGMPVVVADLHSSLPAVVAGVRAVRPSARVAYVMTDGGALPAWFSTTVAGLRGAGGVAAGVTAGPAHRRGHQAGGPD